MCLAFMEIGVVLRCRKLILQILIAINIMTSLHKMTIGLPLESLLLMTPPPGNSLHIKTSTLDGVQVYNCDGGIWRFVSASARLVDSDNSSISRGTYSYVYKASDLSSVGTWSLVNSDGVIAESGHVLSEVTGRVIAFRGNIFALPEFLAQASSHQFQGTASLVSYIQQIPSDGGIPPAISFCNKGSKPVHIPFEADYWFWTQDLEPPSVPAALSASGRRIEGFFGTGYVKYMFNGTSWQQKSLNATMYDVPGGTLIGRFFFTSKSFVDAGHAGLYAWSWEVFNPNGWTVTAKLAFPTVQMDGNSLPWGVFDVTSSVDNNSLLGPITQVQMVSTRGGTPPQAEATLGSVWKSSFSAVCWFYSASR